jgi:HPt (histidine-containing phosphotransfer) domain-containing protein
MSNKPKEAIQRNEKIKEFSKILDIDKEILTDIVNSSILTFPKKLEEIHSTIKSGDIKKVQQQVHGLKGVIGYFGAKSIYDLIYEFETLKDKTRIEDILVIYQSLKTEVEYLCDFFSKETWMEELCL